MSHGLPRTRLTLIFCTLLHMMTHAYGLMLVPLYLLMTADLKLGGIKEASLIVTVYGLVYYLSSALAGELSDRFNRKALLGLGLIGNAAAIFLMGLTHQYALLLALAVMAGLAGTLFHPSANALMTAHYPRSPGMAIGLLGIGSAMGFFLGPEYAGWRASPNAWHWDHMANWQRPCIELGGIGMVIGVIFLLLASETRARSNRKPIGSAAAPRPDAEADHLENSRGGPLDAALRWRVVAIACTLGMRDFAGIANLSLASIYLQKAFYVSVERAGFILGVITLPCIIGNPLMVYLSPGRRRLRFLVCVLVMAGALLMTIPCWPLAGAIAVLAGFQLFHMSSYALSDAAMLERVSPRVRGRVVGRYLTIAGTLGASAPFFVGWWVDSLRSRANQPAGYATAFIFIGTLIAVASVSIPIIAGLGKAVGPAVSPLAEISPATLEVV